MTRSFTTNNAPARCALERLNAVLGTENTENSIGKSTTLLVIDFCFGGSDYIDKAKDVVKNIGHHEIRFAFLLGGGPYFGELPTRRK